MEIQKKIYITIICDKKFCDNGKDICTYSNYENPHCDLFQTDLIYDGKNASRCQTCISVFGGNE
jgi:hypothetical protein